METTKTAFVQPAFKFSYTKMDVATDQVVELSAANDWKGAFENLDAKADWKSHHLYGERSELSQMVTR